MKLNDEFKRKIVLLAGEAGKEWLEELPEIITTYGRKWSIFVDDPFDLSYNYVAPAVTSTGMGVVLKLAYPGNKEFAAEIEALKFFDGKGAVRVLEAEVANGAVLLERAEPGEQLSSIDDDARMVAIVTGVIKKLHKPIKADGRFPTLLDWAKIFDRPKPEPVSKSWFDKAEGIMTEFLQDKKEPVLLHGDLHNDNVLQSQRGWLAIDPKGIVGEQTAELAAFLRNPYYDLPKGSNYKKIEAERINLFAEELGYERERILGWAFVGAVLSMLWFLEDEGVFSQLYLRNAGLLNEITL